MNDCIGSHSNAQCGRNAFCVLFNELEKEYNAFTKIYNQQWEKTKKQIKKNNLNFKNLRGQKEKKGKGKKNDSESD